MRRIEFHNRVEEMEEITRLLDTEPTLITFIYGPINSGKTELINNLIKNLPENQKVFYINLRGRFVSNYDEFIKVLFDVEHEARYGRIQEFLKPIVNVLPGSYHGIPIPKDMFLKLFEEKDVEDAFVYIETVLRAFYESGNVPVLIIDELQVIGDLKVDDLLIYKLFNFFIRLTKELHLAHVFTISSDSLFIEEVHSEAMLEGRCRYLLVDDFDRETTAAFLEKYGFTDDETAVAWEYCGGKPICLVELVNAKLNGKDVESESKKLLKIRTSQIFSIFDEISLGKVEYSEKSILEEFKNFEQEEMLQYGRINKEKIFLVGRNVFFIDPTQRTIKPQSRLNLLAIREVMKSV